ncbi:MAG TPA: spore germination protein [Thermoanaerobacterales bacterium]|nr:spore germination protein [Thermoanaerobacterales bacterium]
MFKKLVNLIKSITHKGENKTTIKADNNPITGIYEKDMEFFRSFTRTSQDCVLQELLLGKRKKIRAILIYIDEMIDKKLLSEQILHPLISEELSFKNIFKPGTTNFPEYELIVTLNEAIEYILDGSAVIIVDGLQEGLVFDVREIQDRQVTEPQTEMIVRGAREGFVESVDTNLALLRKRLKDPDLNINLFELGKRSKTKVAIAYIKGIASDNILEELVDRIDRIDTDIIFDTSYIEEYITDNLFTIFPLVLPTERPDKTAAGLAEGKIAIIADGSPMAILLPATVNQFYQTAEDYNQLWLVSTLIRMLRLLAMPLAIFLPGFHVALLSFHPEIMPRDLLLSIMASREGLPFPIFVEALVMIVTIEILQEAGVRLPSVLGKTIGIVGALIIGQAAVAARITSNTMIIVIAITTIASFAIPSHTFELSLRFIRFGILFLGSTLGLFGVFISLCLLVTHMVTLKSFGVNYFSPFSPIRFRDLLFDTIIRVPRTFSLKRPQADSPSRGVFA